MNTQETTALIQHLSKKLFEIDPMNTGCNVNQGMEDEYLFEARAIADLLNTGTSIREAVKQTFDQAFWVGCLEEASRLQGLDAVAASLAQHE